MLRPQAPTLHSPLLRSNVPDTLTVVGPGAELSSISSVWEALRLPELAVVRAEQALTVSQIPPSGLHLVLSALSGTTVCLTDVSCTGALVAGVSDRLCAWESALAKEAISRKTFCLGCCQPALIPVTDCREGVRCIRTWCIVCLAPVVPFVDVDAYDRLTFLPRGAVIPRIPTEGDESL